MTTNNKILNIVLAVALCANISSAFANPFKALYKEKEMAQEQKLEQNSDKNVNSANEKNQEQDLTTSKKEQKGDDQPAVETSKKTLKNNKTAWWQLEKRKPQPKRKYTIPTDGYMSVGREKNVSGEMEVSKIQGSISKNVDFGLNECLELAIQNNPKIKSAFSNSGAVQTEIGQAWAAYSPQLNLSASVARTKPNLGYISMPAYNRYLIGDISLSQLVYDFGVTQNQVTIKKMNYEQSKIKIDGVINNVVFQVKDAYFYLLYTMEAKTVAQDTVDKFESHYKQAKAFYEIGAKPKIDVTIADVNLSDAKRQLIAAENNVDFAVAALNNVMGMPFIEPYELIDQLKFEKLDINMKKAIEIANNSRPDLKSAQISADQTEQYIKLAKKAYLPSIVAKGGVSFGGQDSKSTNGYDFGGYLNFPLINPVLVKKQIDQAKFLYKKQEYDSQDVVNTVYLEIQQAFIKLTDKTKQVPVARAGALQAKENYELSRGRYRAGVGDAIELKDAEIQYQKARLSLYDALYQYNSAKAQLEKAVGMTLKPVGAAEEMHI